MPCPVNEYQNAVCHPEPRLGHPLVPYQKLRRINKKEGYSQRNGVPLLWSNRKTVCGICVVSNKIKIKKFNFCNKNKKNPLFSFENGGFLVRVAGFEPTASWTRTSTRNFFRVFPAVFSCFRSAPLHLWASLTMLFPCGPEQCVVGSVVRNAPSPCRRLSPTGTGSVFHASNCLHCTSVDRIKQVISVLSTAQKLRDCKQKEAFCSKRLRNLKRMFMSILHSL